MNDRDSDDKLGKGPLEQTIGGQQSHESEYGEQGDEAVNTSEEELMRKESFGGSGAEPGIGSASRPSMGRRGSAEESAASAEATEGTDFAAEGHGAPEQDEANAEGGVG